MRKFFFTILLLLGCCKAVAVIPGWQWGRAGAGAGVTNAVSADGNGNSYIAGHFTGQLFFGPDTLDDGYGPYQNIFAAKYDAAGNAQWAVTALGYADAFGICADAAGNTYLVGDFYNDSIVFGNYVLRNPNAGAQVSNIFFAKYNAAGNLLWVKNLGGINNDNAVGITTDNYGHVFLTGGFIGDSLTLDNITVQHIGNNDAFVARFDTAGNAVWIKNIGAPIAAGAFGLCADISGNVLMTGYFQGNYLIPGNINTPIASPYSSNTFIAKYDSSGLLQWTKFAGGNNGNDPAGISSDATGNIYVTGSYSDSLAFDNESLVSLGYQGVFTAKYDAAGNEVWAKSCGGTYVDQAVGIAADADGNSYITGYSESDTFYFGNTAVPNTTNSQLTFLAAYDTYGNAGWALAPGGRSDNTPGGIAYGNGAIYVGGTFVGAPIVFGNDTLPPSANVFLARLDTVFISGILPVGKSYDELVVYPNPSTGNFYFKGVEPGSLVQVYDITGELIYSGVPSADDFLVNLPGKASGIYLYRVNDKNGVSMASGKIMIE